MLWMLSGLSAQEPRITPVGGRNQVDVAPDLGTQLHSRRDRNSVLVHPRGSSPVRVLCWPVVERKHLKRQETWRRYGGQRGCCPS